MNFWELIGQFFHRPPEFEHLEKYIEIERERRIDPRRDAALAVGFSSVAVGLAAAGGVWAVSHSWFFSLATAIGGAVFGLGWYLRHVTGMTKEHRERTKARSEARLFLEQLRRWKYSRSLRRELGAALGELLNAASLYWLRAHSVLESDVWHSVPVGSHWHQTRERAAAAMDVGMAKVMLIAREGLLTKSDFFSTQSTGIQRVVESMRAVSKECEMLTDRIQAQNTGLQGSHPEDELREALMEMRGLEAAERELDSNVQSHRRS